MGFCDTLRGQCNCAPGFDGSACERMQCPNNCGGHGQCLSMRQAAATNYGWKLNRTATYDEWDADKIFGCICDAGYGGFDCSERMCDVGDSARTRGQQHEWALLYCECPGTCSGTFKLRYKGKFTSISPSYTASQVAAKLMALNTARHNSAEYDTPPLLVSFDGSHTAVCGASGVTTNISFARDGGDLPPVYVAQTSKLFSSTGNATVYMKTVVDLTCTCTASCSGYFNLVAPDGFVSGPIWFHNHGSAIETELYGLAPLSDVLNITATLKTGAAAICESSAVVVTTITVAALWGNVQLGVISSITDGVLSLSGADGTTEGLSCCGGGTCNPFTGRCACDGNFAYNRDYGECGSVAVSSSSWMGRQRCLGAMAFETTDPLDAAAAVKVYAADLGRDVPTSSSITTVYSSYEKTSLVNDPSLVWYNDFNDSSDDRNVIKDLGATDQVTHALALDLNHRKIYWAEGDTLYRRTLPADDVSDEEMFHAMALSFDFGSYDYGFGYFGYLELDLREGSRYAYWTVPGSEGATDGEIWRKSLDATSADDAEELTDIIQASLDAFNYDIYSPQGIALDLREEKLYYVDSVFDGAEDGFVVRCDLDGSNVDVALAHGLWDPRGIALDLEGGYMYITDVGGTPRVVRSDLYNNSGWETNLTTVSDGFYWTSGTTDVWQALVSPESIQVDRFADDLFYFSDSTLGYIYSGELDDDTGGTTSEYLQMGRPMAFRIDLGEGYPEETLFEECYGHGICSGAPEYTCTCQQGYAGVCNEAACPRGPAWFDEALADSTAHRLAECSNMGICDRATGICRCHPMFEGAACERMRCLNDCSGHGRCLSMRQLALGRTDEYLVPDAVSYGSFTNAAATWDADVVSGCSCDWYGYQGNSDGPSYHNASDWTGSDCSLRTCPTGDDPRDHNTTTPGEFEVQRLTCTGDSGSFSLRFRQATTTAIAADATLDELEAALELIATVGDVELNSTGTTACSAAGDAPVYIRFKTELGRLPDLEVYWSTLETSSSTDTAGIAVAEYIAGSKLDVPCSNHGICDPVAGTCTCLGGWVSSDGNSGMGHRGDCGYNPPWNNVPLAEDDAATEDAATA